MRCRCTMTFASIMPRGRRPLHVLTRQSLRVEIFSHTVLQPPLRPSSTHILLYCHSHRPFSYTILRSSHHMHSPPQQTFPEQSLRYRCTTKSGYKAETSSYILGNFILKAQFCNHLCYYYYSTRDHRVMIPSTQVTPAQLVQMPRRQPGFLV